jgi:hypothetical protein
VKQAQECAAALLADDPELVSEELRELRGLVERRWGDTQPER